MESDEAVTIEPLDRSRDVFRQHISAHGGHVIDTAGDSVLATFDSAIEAVQSALEIHTEIDLRNRDVAEDHIMAFRIGINLGDIVRKDDGTVYGDGVNIAARLQSLADPGGLCILGNIHDVPAAPLKLNAHDLGEQTVKNTRTPVRAYGVQVSREVTRHPRIDHTVHRQRGIGIGRDRP